MPNTEKTIECHVIGETVTSCVRTDCMYYRKGASHNCMSDGREATFDELEHELCLKFETTPKQLRRMTLVEVAKINGGLLLKRYADWLYKHYKFHDPPLEIDVFPFNQSAVCPQVTHNFIRQFYRNWEDYAKQHGVKTELHVAMMCDTHFIQQSRKAYKHGLTNHQ